MLRYSSVIVLVCIFSAGSTSAFTVDGYWSHSPIYYEITSSGSDDVWDGSDLEAVRTAFSTWQEVLLNRVSFQEAGLVPWLPYYGDGHNTVGWIETAAQDWRTIYHFVSVYPSLGISGCMYNVPTGEFLECDTFLNGIHYSWSTTGAPGTYDIQKVLNHEVGHFIGLGHSEDPSALMYPSYEASGVVTPQVDDIFGARLTYFGVDVIDFVNRLYHVVLEREPDEYGLAHHVVLILLLGEVETVVRGFFFLPEFLDRIGDDLTAWLTALYRMALNREPDPTGLMHHVDLITSGAMTREELLDGFLATPEAQARAQEKDPFRYR